MRISRRRKKPEEPKKIYFYNEGIKSPRVLVLGENAENIGEMNTGEAIRMAREQELDLVEINPKTNPPVVKIMDFGQYQYQQEKTMRLRKAHQHIIKTKCVRLSLRIGANDLNIRKKQAIEFLEDGNKVKIEVVLRGRENQQAALGFELIKKFINEISAEVNIKYEQETERQGKSIATTIYKT